MESEQLNFKMNFLQRNLEESTRSSLEAIQSKAKRSMFTNWRNHNTDPTRRLVSGISVLSPLWYNTVRCMHDNCVYYEFLPRGSIVFLLLYVDGMLFTVKDMTITRLKTSWKRSLNEGIEKPKKNPFEMKIIRDQNKGKLWIS